MVAEAYLRLAIATTMWRLGKRRPVGRVLVTATPTSRCRFVGAALRKLRATCSQMRQLRHWRTFTRRGRQSSGCPRCGEGPQKPTSVAQSMHGNQPPLTLPFPFLARALSLVTSGFAPRPHTNTFRASAASGMEPTLPKCCPLLLSNPRGATKLKLAGSCLACPSTHQYLYLRLANAEKPATAFDGSEQCERRL